jgi:predicted lipoprotein with Yx(FWY)xxD motif
MRRIALVFGAAALAAALLAATALPATTGPATVKTRKTKLGRVLVGPGGHTLYLFAKDKRGKSSCAGVCADAWRPLITRGAPKALRGAKASKLGTTRRAGGQLQVTYAGHPLYAFAEDTRAGTTKGEGVSAFGAKWFAVSASGRKVRRHAAPPPVSPYPPY